MIFCRQPEVQACRRLNRLRIESLKANTKTIPASEKKERKKNCIDLLNGFEQSTRLTVKRTIVFLLFYLEENSVLNRSIGAINRTRFRTA